ncbi:MAG: pilus assembly FimT family protein [Caldisericum exile]|uniref:pilus assembly FimT family protein n=1 Tax=Caldisericum exile TaxID=693075 RepID=UPI003C71D825
MILSMLHRSKKGFTLIELLTVIVVLMILIGVSMSIMPNVLVEKNLYNAGVQIQQSLLYAQNKAITYSTSQSSGNFEIYFFPQLNTYYVEKDINARFDPNTNSITGKVEKIVLPSNIKIKRIYLAKSDDTTTILSPPLTYVSIVFNNFGNPNYYSKDKNYGIFLSNDNETKILGIYISKLGSVSIDWVKR